MIEVKNLTKRYGPGGQAAVEGLSFKLAGNRVIGLLGPNGAGKSTTMNMITGCLAPTEGSVRVNGFDMARDPVRAKKCIGYLPEIPPLYVDMTVREYLLFVAEARGLRTTDGQEQVREAMALTGLEGVRDRLIKALSKGYRQRVGIAMTLLGDPDTIILDEPTVGLDPAQIIEIRHLIRRLGERKTVIVSSHILSEIGELCDHVLILSHGHLVADDSVENLRESLAGAHLLRISVRGSADEVAAVLQDVEGVLEFRSANADEVGVSAFELKTENDSGLRDRIFFAMAEKHLAVLSMEITEPDLETIFLSFTGSLPGDNENESLSAATDTAEVTDGNESENGNEPDEKEEGNE